MMTVISFIGYTLLTLIGIIFFILLVVGLKFTLWFSCRRCKLCKHTMEYWGRREYNHVVYYIFYCKHCNSWEEVPREEFLRDCDINCAPL